jgi:hypothetical protein
LSLNWDGTCGRGVRPEERRILISCFQCFSSTKQQTKAPSSSWSKAKTPRNEENRTMLTQNGFAVLPAIAALLSRNRDNANNSIRANLGQGLPNDSFDDGTNIPTTLRPVSTSFRDKASTAIHDVPCSPSDPQPCYLLQGYATIQKTRQIDINSWLYPSQLFRRKM